MDPVLSGVFSVEDVEMSSSSWWISPEDAAAGGLDHVPIDLWPRLAARWLAAGFNTESLRQLAQLQSEQYPAGIREDRRDPRRGAGALAQPVPVPRDLRHMSALAALDLMPDVLESLGFDPAASDAQFTARCQGAVDVVQRDLDVTGYEEVSDKTRELYADDVSWAALVPATARPRTITIANRMSCTPL
jgi:hypothetical protein